MHNMLALLQRPLKSCITQSLSSGPPKSCLRRTMIATNDAFFDSEATITSLAASISPRALSLVRAAYDRQRGKEDFNVASTFFRTNPSPITSTTNGVFANRELDMGKISAIGFDYDYTLAAYKTSLQHFIYDEAKYYLLVKGGYPKQLADLKFEKDFAVRGLTFDRRTGMLLKQSFFQRVGRTYLGRRRVSHQELVNVYGKNLHLSRNYVEENCVWVNDLFSLSEACLLSDVVQLAVDAEIDFDPYALQQDVQTAISHVHTSGLLRDAVANDPELFLHANPSLKPLLKRWRDAGKQLFLLTNSTFPFVNAGMKYIVDDDNWRDLFDIVITASDKPRFFTQDTPFRCLNHDKGDASFAMWHPVTEADLDRVLVGGSVERLANLAGWANRNVLYFGDHLHSDLVEPRRTRGWFTGAIIRELEHEFLVQQSDDFRRLLDTMFQVEGLLNDVQLDENVIGMNQQNTLQELLNVLEQVRFDLNAEIGNLFNPHFGSIFRSLRDPSAYALALFKGCDIYTTRIENFADYMPEHRFYPVHADHLPHEKLYPVVLSEQRSTESG